jgi:hypothetical protein
MYKITNKICNSFSKKQENPFKKLVTNLNAGGKQTHYYSIPSLNDPRVGNILTYFR